MWVAGLASGSLLGLFESVALSVGFDDVDSVGEAVKESSGEPLRAEDLGPVFEGEIGSYHEALTFIGTADYLEEELSSCLRKWHVPQFIQHQEMLTFQLLVKSLERSVFPTLQKLGDQTGDRGETDPVALDAC